MKNETTVRTEIHYAQAGDYQLPLLTLPQIDSREPLGKYARMRLTYLKTQRPVLYNRMLLNGSLWPHLQDTQKTACAWLERTMNTLLDKYPVPDKERAGRFLDFLQMRPERTVQQHLVVQHRTLILEIDQPRK